MVLGLVTVEDVQELANKVAQLEENFNQLVKELQESIPGHEEEAPETKKK